MTSVHGYVFTERLGKGTYGEVFKAVSHKNRDVVAVKRMLKKSLCKRAQDNLVEEIGILKKLQHRNIVEMTNFTWDSDYVYIFMEYMAGGDLSTFLKSQRHLPERTIRYFLQQLAFALHYLYERNIVHMDIKPQNILMTTSTPPTLKLADFGFAKSMNETVKMNEIRGSLLYMAPEIYNFGVYEKSCDLWSVGVIFYECLFGRTPFASATVEELKVKLSSDSPIVIPNRPSFSKDCIDLVSKMLKRNPEERIHHEQFFTHQFIDLAHAPCPKSIQKAADNIVIAEDLAAKGNLVDAFLNYKEGLTHLVSALQIESDASKRRIIRAKLTHYMKVAEDLSRKIDSNNWTSETMPNLIHSSASVARAKGSALPASKRPPFPALSMVDTARSPRDNVPPPAIQNLSITPTSFAPVSPLSDQPGADSKGSSFAVPKMRAMGLLASWFSAFTGSSGAGAAGLATTHFAAPSADVGAESASQSVVKTANEYAIQRIDALKELSCEVEPESTTAVDGLRTFYTYLNNNEFKCAMDYIQQEFGKWLKIVKGVKNAEAQKSFRSELNEALTAAEKLKEALRTSAAIAPPPLEDDGSEQSCLIS